MRHFFLNLFPFLLVFILFSCSSEVKHNKNKDNNLPLLLSDTSQKASCVFLTKDHQNNPAISWVEINPKNKEKSFYFARWDSSTHHFSKSTSIPIPKNTSIHEEGMPKIAFNRKGTIYAFFETNTPMKGNKWGIGDIQSIFSIDNGKTWTSPVSIYPNKPQHYSISFSGITSLKSGKIGITCLGTNKDTALLGRPVLFFKSQGNHFSAPTTITKEACECCRTAIASSSNGRISVAFRDLQSGNIRDINVSTSIDGGLLFHYNKDVSDDNWKINGCPHNGPSIATLHNKNIIAWSTGGKNAGVHLGKFTSSGQPIYRKYLSKNGQFIQMCLLPDATIMSAYNESYMDSNRYDSRIILTKITDSTFTQKTITPKNVSASYPVITSINNNSVIVAWRNDDFTVHYRIIDITTITNKGKAIAFPNQDLQKEALAQSNMIKDVICHMNFDKSMAADSILYQGKTYHFCSKHCKHSFLKNPDKYSRKE